jgi:hypothetical protein
MECAQSCGGRNNNDSAILISVTLIFLGGLKGDPHLGSSKRYGFSDLAMTNHVDQLHEEQRMKMNSRRCHRGDLRGFDSTTWVGVLRPFGVLSAIFVAHPVGFGTWRKPILFRRSAMRSF